RSNATIGDNAGADDMLNAAFAQHPFEPRHVERGESDLFDAGVGGTELVDELLAPGARQEVALAQERPQRLQMRRDDRVAAPPRHQCEQCRDDETAFVAERVGERLQPRRQCGDVGALGAAARIGAVRMDEVVLQIQQQQRGRCEIHARSTMTLPRWSMLALRPGSMKIVASGCSSTAGALIVAPYGRSSRDHTLVSCQAPPWKTLRVPFAALSSDASASGAKAVRSKAGRRPIAAVRKETMRVGMPGSSRPKAAS